MTTIRRENPSKKPVGWIGRWPGDYELPVRQPEGVPQLVRDGGRVTMRTVGAWVSRSKPLASGRIAHWQERDLGDGVLERFFLDPPLDDRAA